MVVGTTMQGPGSKMTEASEMYPNQCDLVQKASMPGEDVWVEGQGSLSQEPNPKSQCALPATVQCDR